MKFEVSERIETGADKEALLRVLEEQFRKVSANVSRQENSLVVESMKTSSVSFLWKDTTTVDLKNSDGGFLVIGAVSYCPSLAFWISSAVLLVGGAACVIGVVLCVIPAAIFLRQKGTVANSVQDVLKRVKNEFKKGNSSVR